MCSLQKNFPNPRTHRFSSLFSSKSFIVLHSSLNKFRINFCVWWGNKGWSSCFTDTHPVVKSNISFPHWIILPFRQKYVWIFFWILFSIPLFYNFYASSTTIHKKTSPCLLSPRLLVSAYRGPCSYGTLRIGFLDMECSLASGNRGTSRKKVLTNFHMG